MRLIIMGQQAFGKDVLEKILDAGVDEVVAVYCEPDREGGSVDPIKEFALEKGIKVYQPAHFKDQAERYTKTRIDLFPSITTAAASWPVGCELAHYYGKYKIRLLVVLSH